MFRSHDNRRLETFNTTEVYDTTVKIMPYRNNSFTEVSELLGV